VENNENWKWKNEKKTRAEEKETKSVRQEEAGNMNRPKQKWKHSLLKKAEKKIK
jgi:hypothetical protein